MRIEITHRLDWKHLAELLCLGQAFFNSLARIEQKLENLMARSQEMTDLITKLNTTTNTLATRIQALRDEITNAGMSAAEEAAAIAELNAIGTTLENMGANPADPLPAVVPTP